MAPSAWATAAGPTQVRFMPYFSAARLFCGNHFTWCHLQQCCAVWNIRVLPLELHALHMKLRARYCTDGT